MARIINQQLIEKALLDAFSQWAEEDINDAHWDDQFKKDRWRYDNITRRKNAEEVGPEPRDIYDLGNLYRSGVESFTLTREATRARANWHWDAKNQSGEEYAWYVHEGRGTNVTARRFTDDISIPSSFFFKSPGRALQLRVQQHLDSIGL